MTDTQLEFYEIKDFKGYKINKKGEIYSDKSKQILTQSLLNGYKYVSINNKRACVHRLIAFTFLPQIEGKNIVNHINSDKLDNRLENLEWVTRSENMKHSVNVLGKKFRGTLTDDDVKYIKENYKPKCRKFGAIPLGNKFGISESGILYHIKQK